MAPFSLGGVVRGGWKLEGIRIVHSRIEYVLARGPERIALVLLPPFERGVSGRMASSSSFVMSPKASARILDQGARDALQALAHRVEANDGGTFWSACAGGRQVVSDLGWLLDVDRAVLVLMLVLAVLGFRGFWTALGDQGRRYWLAMLGICVLAVTLRALVPPHAPLHSNTHGLREMRELLVGQDALIPNLLVGQYGWAKQALLPPLVTLAGKTARALLWTNIVLGSLTPLFLGLASTLATRSRAAGLLAALLLACLPAHVRLSASESGLVAYNLLLALALVVAQVAVRAGQLRHLVLLGLMAGFTAQLHVVAVAAPGLLFMALLYDPERPSWRGRSWWKLLAAFVLTLALLLPHALAMVADHWQAARGRGALTSLQGWLSTQNLMLNPEVTPILVPLCCLAGLLLLGRRRYLAALVWGIAIVAFSWLHNTVCASFSDAVRYQATPLMLTLPPAGYALARLAGRCEGGLLRTRSVLAAVATLAVLASALPGLRLIAQVDNEAQEYLFWERSIPGLPRQATLVLLDERLAGGKVLTDFPDFLLLEQGKRWDVVRQSEVERRPLHTRGPLLLYAGLTCHSFTPEEIRSRAGGSSGKPTLRQECREFRRRHDLEPLSEEVYRSRRLRWSARRPYYFHLIPAETITVGFYLVKANRPRSSEPRSASSSPPPKKFP